MIFCPILKAFFEVIQGRWKLFNIFFMSDFCGHFDIWNYLEKNFFFSFDPKYFCSKGSPL